MATVLDPNGLRYAQLASDPASPVAGQVYYNTTQKELRQYDGEEWQQVAIGDWGFKYRTIITTSYIMCGYKNSVPYNNANRMVHSTDVMTDLGNTMQYATAYTTGAPSKTRSWVFGADGQWSVANVIVISMNHATDTGVNNSSANNLNVARNDAGVAFKETEYVHITSDTTSTKFNFTTETAAAGLTGLIANGTQGGIQALVDQNHAHLYGDSTGQQIVFATDTVNVDRVEGAAWSGANNQQKPINTKYGKGYIGNEGGYNGGYNYRVYDMKTNVLSRTVTRPLQNSGEENFDMGQDHQYCMGMYDGAQNNRGHKFFYSTDTGYELGAGSIRTGVPGGSSGVCGWKG